MTTLVLRHSISRSPLPRRSPATGGRKWACRAVVPRRRDEGGSLITYHYPATPKPIEGGSLLTVLLLALCCFALCLAPKAFGVSPPPDGGYANENTAEGQDALFSLTTGTANTANGYVALYSNTTGTQNTANGFDALGNNTTGSFNTANGSDALTVNTTGSNNTANGAGALFDNTTGAANTADGYVALNSNTSGVSNTATGSGALHSNTTASNNTANGSGALADNTTGHDNMASGFAALSFNATGDYNTATGSQALLRNTTGNSNTANGFQALSSNATGSGNVALGYLAGSNLTTGSYNIDIGNYGVAGESDTIRIGTEKTQTAIYVAGIVGTHLPMSTPVFVNAHGQLGTTPSSQRFKADIKPMDKASEAILALKPVTFRYKHDPAGAGPQFGLVAEQVEKVNPDLVVRDAEGKIFSVRYEAVNAMLLNEFLKEHRKVENQEATITQLKSAVAKQEATIAQQQKGMEVLTASLKEQASQIRKVSAQLELSKAVSQLVSNQ